MNIFKWIGFIVIGILFVFLGRLVVLHYFPVYEKNSYDIFHGPPTEALVGTITEATGSVKRYKRATKQWEKPVKDDTVTQGEAIKIEGDGIVSVWYEGIGGLELRDWSSVILTSTIPSSVVFSQESGEVLYDVQNSSQLVSVRTSQLLIELLGSIATVRVDNDTLLVTVSINKGEGTVAFVDTDNTTYTKKIPEGKKLIFNTVGRTYRLLNALP